MLSPARLIRIGIIALLLAIALIAAPLIGLDDLGPAFDYGYILGPILIFADIYIFKLAFKISKKNPES